jgi:hypothetical protein
MIETRYRGQGKDCDREERAGKALSDPGRGPDPPIGFLFELNAWLGERCRVLCGELRHPEIEAPSVAAMPE